MSNNSLGWSWKPPPGLEKILRDGNKKTRDFYKREAAKYVPVQKPRPKVG